MERERRPIGARGSAASATFVLAFWIALSCVFPVLLADRLDALHLAGFPFGFWFAQQGAVLAFVLLIGVYVAWANRREAGDR